MMVRSTDNDSTEAGAFIPSKSGDMTALLGRWLRDLPETGDEPTLAARHVINGMLDLQVKQSQFTRENLVRSMLSVGLDPTPPVYDRHARRVGALRRRLLTEEGAYTYEQLAEVAGSASAAAVRAWVSSQRKQGTNIISVVHEGATLVPAFQLDLPDLHVREDVAAVLNAIAPADGWTAWTWFATPTGLLSGERPLDVLETNLSRVEHAASRFGARAAA